MFCVVNPDYTYAGAPCETFEEAQELAAQKEGRKIYILWDVAAGTATKTDF